MFFDVFNESVVPPLLEFLMGERNIRTWSACILSDVSRFKVKTHFCNAIGAHVKGSCVPFLSRYLVHCLQADLNNYMPAFLDDPEEHNPQRPKIGVYIVLPSL